MSQDLHTDGRNLCLRNAFGMHDVTVNGGNLNVINSIMGHDVTIDGGSFQFNNSQIGHDLHIQHSEPGIAPDTVCGTNIGHDAHVENNTAPISFAARSCTTGNRIGHDMHVENNSSVQVFHDVVQHNLECMNDASISGGGDSASRKAGQCASF